MCDNCGCWTGRADCPHCIPGPASAWPLVTTCPDCGQVYGPDAHVCAVSGGTRCPRCHELCPDNEVEGNICIDCYENGTAREVIRHDSKGRHQ